MAFELHSGPKFPGKAASAIPPRTAVVLGAGGARQVHPASGAAARPIGVTGDASAALGDAVRVYLEGNVVKAVAAASLGPAAEVGVASGGVSFVPLALSAAGSVLTGQSVGQAVDGAAAGGVFSLYVNPRVV